jgi:hypothetical protein
MTGAAASRPRWLRLAVVAAWCLLGLWALWCAGALWYAPWPWWVRLLLAVAYGASFLVPRPTRRILVAAGASLALTLGWCLLVRPSLDRPDWSPDQARLPRVEYTPTSRDIVRVDGVRNCDYRSTSDFDLRWEDREYDLRTLDSVWFVVEPFAVGSPAAHTFLSFGFAGRDFVAISVEIRKQRGERFSPLAGLFRRYELIYVIADERDVIRLRANYRHDPVYIYPLRATREQARTLFEDMLARAERLRVEPEFYNTLTDTCTTNIVAHVNAVWPGTVPLRREILLPGDADRLAYQLGLIACDEPFERCRERFRVNERAAAADQAADFSRRIRE